MPSRKMNISRRRCLAEWQETQRATTILPRKEPLAGSTWSSTFGKRKVARTLCRARSEKKRSCWPNLIKFCQMAEGAAAERELNKSPWNRRSVKRQAQAPKGRLIPSGFECWEKMFLSDGCSKVHASLVKPSVPSCAVPPQLLPPGSEGSSQRLPGKLTKCEIIKLRKYAHGHGTRTSAFRKSSARFLMTSVDTCHLISILPHPR